MSTTNAVWKLHKRLYYAALCRRLRDRIGEENGDLHRNERCTQCGPKHYVMWVLKIIESCSATFGDLQDKLL